MPLKIWMADGWACFAESTYHSPTDAFKGFDQGQHHGITNTMGLDSEEEPRRGTSRANSVRFDESAIQGYSGQANRSTSELPLRSGSGLSSFPLSERSLSHRSDGRQSSPGHSYHSARTNSLGLETTSRLMSSSNSGSPLMPPPCLFLLGPVPCIIRCWLTTNFSNDTLLYAAVCSGSYTSSLGYSMVQKLGMEDLVTQEEDSRFIKLPLYLPEASVHQSSSRCSSPGPQLPTLTIRFIVRDVDPNDQSIQIILGSDVLRSHNADILFSQDKITMTDDERHKVSIPLVRPENDSIFTSLYTAPDTSRAGPTKRPQHENEQPQTNGHGSVGVIGQPAPSSLPRQSTSAPASARVSIGESEDDQKPSRSGVSNQILEDSNAQQEPAKSPAAVLSQPSAPGTGPWGSWRRDSKLDSSAATAGSKASRGRTMKVLRPTKPTRVSSTTSTAPGFGNVDSSAGSLAPSQPDGSRQSNQSASSRALAEEFRPNRQWGSNPIGGASAFGWLNSPQPTRQLGNKS